MLTNRILGTRSRRLRRVLMYMQTIVNRLRTGWGTLLIPIRRLQRTMRTLHRPKADITLRHSHEGGAHAENEQLVVLTANLWHDWPRHRRLPARLETFARLVESEGAQVVLLQEVVRSPQLRADEWLAERLGMGLVYTRANGHAGSIGFEEGVAILSKYPISEPRHLLLQPSKVPYVNRVALGTQVETPSGKFWAFSTHLSLLRQVNEAQIAHLRSWITATTGNEMAMIGGDFNAVETSPQMELIREDWVDIYRHFHPRTDGSTFKVRMPWGGSIWRARLDYLFLQPGPSPCRIIDARHIEASPNHYSDHQSVIARLECRGQNHGGGPDRPEAGRFLFTSN